MQQLPYVSGKGHNVSRIRPSTWHIHKGNAQAADSWQNCSLLSPQSSWHAHIRDVVSVVMLWLLSGTVPLAPVICIKNCRCHQQTRGRGIVEVIHSPLPQVS